MEEKKNKKKTLTIISIILLILLALLLFKSCSKYSVEFLNVDGTLLQKTAYRAGELPEYGGTTPSYSDGIYDYSFTGWDKTITKVNSEQTYTATYTRTYIKHDPIVIAPSANTLTYNGSQQKLITKGSTDGGTLQYKLNDGEYSTSIPVAANAGTYTIYYKVVGDDQYNDVNEQSLTVTVNKAQATILVNQKPITVKYGEKLTIPAAKADFGTVNCDKTSEDMKDAGSYTITYSIKGTDNYFSDTKTISVTIARRDVILTSATASKTYDGTPLTDDAVVVSGDGFAPGEDASYSVTGSRTAAGSNKNTFTYTLSSNTDADNYNITVVEGNLIVNKAKILLPVAVTGLTYNGLEQIGAELPEGANYTLTGNKKTDAGDYTATAVLTDKNNYEWDLTTPTSDDQSIDWSISKATAVLSNMTLSDWTYGGTANTPSAETTYGNIVYTYSDSESGNYTSTVPTNAGTYYVKASVEAAANYNGAESTISFNINKADRTIYAERDISGTLITVSYDGETCSDVKYAISTEESAPADDSNDWQSNNEFSVDNNTPYYVFARFTETDNYNSGVCSYEVSGCFAAGTKITMADGSLKNIEDIAAGESVLTFNHEKGIYEAQKVFLTYAGLYKAKTFTLHFENGTTLSIVAEHDLFEKEELKYVTLCACNAEQYIGKHFYSVQEGKYIELTSISYETEMVDFYSIYTETNANCIANGMLTVPYDTEDSLNIYVFNEDLTIDAAQLNADIAKYGLFEYPTDAFYPKEYYDVLHMKYINIMVGKGLISLDGLLTRTIEGLNLKY